MPNIKDYNVKQDKTPDNQKTNSIEVKAADIIRGCMVQCGLPAELVDKPFCEIAKYRDENGKTGVSIIGDAWNLAIQSRGLNNANHPINDRDLSSILLDLASMSSGSGLFDTQLQNIMAGFDKYGKAMLMPNIEMSGLTFFTRPRLCLQSSNLRNNPIMSPLDTRNPNSVAFAIRALLDTNLANRYGKNCEAYTKAIDNCPLINKESPWLIPLSNALTSLGGLPDYDLTTENTTGGYFSESQKYAIGADNFSTAGYSISCEFREFPGGILSALFFYWLEYIRCVVRGDMMAYPDDIDGQIINYTISIYTFNMDPSMQYITKWAKCTGCFPKSLNIGSVLNKNSREAVSSSAQNISVSFECNKVEYMNPDSLMDFNTLATRYCRNINKYYDEKEGKWKSAHTDATIGSMPSGLARPAIPDSPFANFCGLPFIVSDPNGYRLLFRQSDHDLYSNPIVRKLIACDIARTAREWTIPGGKNAYALYQKYNYNDFWENDMANAVIGAANPFSFDQVINSIKDGTFLDSTNKTT